MAAVLALIAAVGWGSSDFAAGTASRRSTPESVVLFTHLVAAICLLPIAIAAGIPAAPDLAWGAVAGLGGAMGALLLYRGLAKGLMAVVAPVTAAGAAAIPVVFGLARGEQLTLLGIVGIAAALAAIVLMSLGPADTDEAADEPMPDVTGRHAGDAATAAPDATTADPDEALVWRQPWLAPALLVGAVVFATATAATPTIAAILTGAPLPPGGAITLAFAVITLLIALVGVLVLLPVISPRRPTAKAARTRRTSGQPGLIEAVFSGVGFGMFFVALSQTSADAGMWPLVSARGVSVLLFVGVAALAGLAIVPDASTRGSIVVAGVFDAMAAVSFLLASRSGLLSIAAVLSSLYPGVTVLLARVVTRERCDRTQVIGLAVAGSAVGFLALA